MRYLTQLAVDGLRNLEQVAIDLHPRLNIIHGNNGAGKTSLLEAIHLLGLGRSFRSGKLQNLINRQRDVLYIRAQTSLGERIALSKREDAAKQVLKLNGQTERSWRQVLEMLPLQLLHADSFSLLDGPSLQRRRYLDWGVFHVEHVFMDDWRGLVQSLRQRNALLKQKPRNYSVIKPWDQGFVEYAMRVAAAREAYFEALTPYLEAAKLELLPQLEEVSFSLHPGWQQKKPLDQVLVDNFERDSRYGATQQGPHRADLLCRLGGHPVSAVLSRGQLKMLVIALKLAQTRHFLQEHRDSTLLYLIDDLPSELDSDNCQKVFELLAVLPCQIFLTTIDIQQLPNNNVFSVTPSMFHVEHGKISV